MITSPVRPLVKICGIRQPEHAVVAADAGADLIGLVFYPPSPRNVSVPEARSVIEAIDGTGVRAVGLFVNESSAFINAVADDVGLDLIQLSGEESPDIFSEISRPVIPSIRIDSSGRVNEEQRFQAIVDATPRPWAVMIDAHVPGMYGGTGTVADWFVAADFASRYRTVLAGGLRPENVAEAIHRVKPYAVDVSSGVETGGIKDITKIRAFVAAATSAAVTRI